MEIEYFNMKRLWLSTHRDAIITRDHCTATHIIFHVVYMFKPQF